MEVFNFIYGIVLNYLVEFSDLLCSHAIYEILLHVLEVFQYNLKVVKLYMLHGNPFKGVLLKENYIT